MKKQTSGPDRLNICLLSYRSNPHSGGQGIYLKNLARELKGLGHRVAVVAGPPGPELPPDIPVNRIPGLDLYNPGDPFRTPKMKELADPVNLMEWLGVITGGFPEPFTFGIRAYRFVASRYHDFDIVHDNQGLSYGTHAIGELLPLVATIHHPISVDRDIAVRNAPSIVRKVQQLRWHSFIGMQKRVARSFSPIITVSQSARDDIAEQFGIDRKKFAVISNGVDMSLFRPLSEIHREKNRVITINSADIPLKGLGYLLQAVAGLSDKRKLRLIVVGTSKKNGTIHRLIRNLGIGDQVTFTGRIDDASFIREYARAEVAVIPSVYEGFGLPAAEAMACGVPVISTTGGALPEVVGDAGILVPPADHGALAGAMDDLLGNPTRLAELGKAGLQRARRYFSWRRTAEETVGVYKEAINDHLRS
ncbi:MAG: glycosyltransferase family 4 protein [Thermodesulfobacteriota bacterium]|nr:glycosyltransferase family 4 protein [Thermodesulfobacteriota bacterium]